MTTPTEIRALIERAAKAVGARYEDPYGGEHPYWIRPGKKFEEFDPVFFAEDCETLVVVLRIDVEWADDYVTAIKWSESTDRRWGENPDPHKFSEDFPPDATPEQKRDAMRMAVLRAAATSIN